MTVTIREAVINEKSNILTGQSGQWGVFYNGTNLVKDTGKSRFSGNRCTSLISKVIAYTASFFGFGQILKFEISKEVCGKSVSESTTFWVKRKVSSYVDCFRSKPNTQVINFENIPSAEKSKISESTSFLFGTRIHIHIAAADQNPYLTEEGDPLFFATLYTRQFF